MGQHAVNTTFFTNSVKGKLTCGGEVKDATFQLSKNEINDSNWDTFNVSAQTYASVSLDAEAVLKGEGTITFPMPLTIKASLFGEASVTDYSINSFQYSISNWKPFKNTKQVTTSDSFYFSATLTALIVF